MLTISRHDWTLLAIIFVYSFVPVIGGLLRVIELGGGSAFVPLNPRALASPLPIVLHILSSSLFCIVGALQFLPSIRRHYPAMHRVAGRMVAAAGCISALTGLWMTHFFAFPDELQGHLLYWARISLSLLMVGLIVWAVISVRSRNILGHRAAMLRAYAIGQGASTQSVLFIGWMVVFGTEPLGSIRDSVMIAAWALNMLIAELLNRTMFAPRSADLRNAP